MGLKIQGLCMSIGSMAEEPHPASGLLFDIRYAPGQLTVVPACTWLHTAARQQMPKQARARSQLVPVHKLASLNLITPEITRESFRADSQEHRRQLSEYLEEILKP